MRKRCSIQQGERSNCWSGKNPKNRLFLFFLGGGAPTNDKVMANPENDSPYEITHKKKINQIMIFVLL